MAWPKGKPRGGDRFAVSEKTNKPETTVESGDRPSENNAGACVAKIQFDAVLLEFEIQRLGGSKGIASSNTARFSRSAGNTIELDTATGLVTIGHTSGGVYVVPIQRVKTFEPLPTEDKPATA